MMRSLYSAISGLQNHQIRMDVIGNNIANVNTPGFKRSRVTFSTMLSQTLKGASASAAGGTSTIGGTNSIQIGLGTMLGAVDKIMTQGSAQSTGKNTDLMIQGPGFFELSDGSNTKSFYTRNGAFGFDKDGNLIDPATGLFVHDINGNKITIDPNTYTSFSIDQTGTITVVDTNNQTATIATIKLVRFANDAGLDAVGNNYYIESNNSGGPLPGIAGQAGTTGQANLAGTSIIPNTLEMSNVDLSQEFTDMIVTQRGFQANSRVITVSDTLLQELIDLKRQ